MRRALLAVAVFTSLAALAQDDPRGAGASLRLTEDTDGLRSRRAGLWWYTSLGGEGRLTGVGAEGGRYTEAGWRADTVAVTFVHRDTDRRTAEGLRLATSITRVGTRHLATADVDWSREIGGGRRIGLAFSRDWVETRRGLEDGLRFELAGVSLDQVLGERWTVTAFAAAQRFSDGNTRTHARMRLIHALVPSAGITAQLRYREFHSDDLSVERRYFNPERYRQWLGVVAMRRRFEGGWSVLAELGAGRQQVERERWEPSDIATLAIMKTYDEGAWWRLRLDHLKAASFGGPNYRYRSLGVEGALPF